MSKTKYRSAEFRYKNTNWNLQLQKNFSFRLLPLSGYLSTKRYTLHYRSVLIINLNLTRTSKNGRNTVSLTKEFKQIKIFFDRNNIFWGLPQEISQETKKKG